VSYSHCSRGEENNPDSCDKRSIFRSYSHGDLAVLSSAALTTCPLWCHMHLVSITNILRPITASKEATVLTPRRVHSTVLRDTVGRSHDGMTTALGC
jgi:hypothetical protein